MRQGLTRPGDGQLGWTGWPASLRDPPVHTSPALELEACTQHFYLGSDNRSQVLTMAWQSHGAIRSQPGSGFLFHTSKVGFYCLDSAMVLRIQP